MNLEALSSYLSKLYYRDVGANEKVSTCENYRIISFIRMHLIFTMTSQTRNPNSAKCSCIYYQLGHPKAVAIAKLKPVEISTSPVSRKCRLAKLTDYAVYKR